MPTSRGRNHDEAASGTIPRRANTKPMRADSDARRTSIGSVMVMPTPTAGPLMAPITGFNERKIRNETSPPPSRGTPAEVWMSEPPRLKVSAPSPEVGAGAEPAPSPGHDDRPHVVVRVGAVERVDELVHHLVGERVEPVGAIEGDGGDAVGHVEGDLGVLHARDGTRTAGRGPGPASGRARAVPGAAQLGLT